MKIAVIGNGRVGSAAVAMLREAGHEPMVFDIGDDIDYSADLFLAATPWQATRVIAAEISKLEGRMYFDLTEDVEVGKLAREGSKSVMFPHCGLAPGAVSIIAGSMLPTKDVIIRVGALPQHPKGQLRYSLTWNTWGVVNEYTKPCPALRNGKYVLLDPLEDLILVGEYEAFNTSGGIGTLAETARGRAMNITYQTVRYQGHCKRMKDLLEMMQPCHVVDYLEHTLPHGGPDKVVIQVNDYGRTIYPVDGMSAIQRATAAGVVAVMLWAMEHDLPVRNGNWVAMEDIPLHQVAQYKCWQDVY